MKKYILIIVISIYCSLITQYAKPDTPPLKTEHGFSSLQTARNIALRSSDPEDNKDKRSNILIFFIKNINFNKQLYYGLTSGIMDAGQHLLVAYFVFRPLSLIHDPYDETLKLRELIIGAVFEELIFNGHLLRLVNFSLEYVTDRNSNDDEIIFILSNIIKSTIFGLLHLTNPNPSILQVTMSSINSFSRGQLCKYHGLLSATISHVTLNSIGYLLILYREHFFSNESG
ncbi:type II CAAX prenyl endopeptidase Rce1 family protein [Endozoicomonas sp. 8E]|uniref:CPBP family glutamic-type intramembrane protease n=1 Tax=Endozoicomonas sp. 8E TaxID=3035692 RepID=UPI002938D010|nr:CPBP family glutamic-type intramembrane protease [Endozoicomonas sp. 8E]WOG28320.1 CPBP family glutamic-type intramembrane protease [Endozoicomonas sp. 8E]